MGGNTTPPPQVLQRQKSLGKIGLYGKKKERNKIKYNWQNLALAKMFLYKKVLYIHFTMNFLSLPEGKRKCTTADLSSLLKSTLSTLPPPLFLCSKYSSTASSVVLSDRPVTTTAVHSGTHCRCSFDPSRGLASSAFLNSSSKSVE